MKIPWWLQLTRNVRQTSTPVFTRKQLTHEALAMCENEPPCKCGGGAAAGLGRNRAGAARRRSIIGNQGQQETTVRAVLWFLLLRQQGVLVRPAIWLHWHTNRVHVANRFRIAVPPKPDIAWHTKIKVITKLNQGYRTSLAHKCTVTCEKTR